MSTTHRYSTPRARTTVPIRGTYTTTTAQLDFKTALGIQWATRWHAEAGGLKVPASGVLRRAVAVYLDHLAQLPDDHQPEFRRMRAACTTLRGDDDDYARAIQRLEALNGDLPLPPFLDVLHGPGARADAAAVNDRVDALLAQIAAEKIRRMNEGRARKRAERLAASASSANSAANSVPTTGGKP